MDKPFEATILRFGFHVALPETVDSSDGFLKILGEEFRVDCVRDSDVMLDESLGKSHLHPFFARDAHGVTFL
jgi:hypothetical protein